MIGRGLLSLLLVLLPGCYRFDDLYVPQTASSITHVGSPQTSTTSVIGMPAGVLPGDLLMFTAYLLGTSMPITGWLTEDILVGPCNYYLFAARRIADGTEGAVLDLGSFGGLPAAASALVAYRGVSAVGNERTLIFEPTATGPFEVPVAAAPGDVIVIRMVGATAGATWQASDGVALVAQAANVIILDGHAAEPAPSVVSVESSSAACQVTMSEALSPVASP